MNFKNSVVAFLMMTYIMEYRERKQRGFHYIQAALGQKLKEISSPSPKVPYEVTSKSLGKFYFISRTALAGLKIPHA